MTRIRINTVQNKKKIEKVTEQIPIEKIVKGNHFHLKMMFDKVQVIFFFISKHLYIKYLEQYRPRRKNKKS